MLSRFCFMEQNHGLSLNIPPLKCVDVEFDYQNAITGLLWLLQERRTN